MKRLVYSPRVNVWVKRDDNKIIDLSDFVTDVRVSRRINTVSKATITFRNPKLRFTNYKWPDGEGPMFHPMDPIIISMTRIKNRPIQVFTGFCDKTPYLQLFPGPCVIEASCTLKRLQYTYWDPGLPFVWDFLTSNGWVVDKARGGIANSDAEGRDIGKQRQLTDGSIGGLLYNTLRVVGGWPDKSIFIENVPPNIVPIVEKIFKDVKTGSKEAQEEFEYVLKKMIGETTLGTGGGGGVAGDGEGVTGTADISGAPEALRNFPRKEFYSKSELLALCEAAGFDDPGYAAGVGWCEGAGGLKRPGLVWTKSTSGLNQWCCHGIWQLYLGNTISGPFPANEKGLANARDPIISTWYVKQWVDSGNGWSKWDCHTFGMVNRIG